MKRQAYSAGGFTLVELLAVIVLMSMVAGMAATRLSASSESARLRAAAAQWRDLDARARLFGRTHGAAVMSVEPDRGEVTLRAAGSNELLATVQLPAAVGVQLHTTTPGDAFAFDTRGHSDDYEVELHRGETVIRWRVTGLTGLIREIR